LYHLKTEAEMIGRTNEECGTRKNIFAAAVFITVVMAIVLVAFSSPASAAVCNRTFTPTGGDINYTGVFEKEADDTGAVILLVYNWASGDESGGEKIKFFNWTESNFTTVWVEGPYTKGGDQCSGYELDKEEVQAGDEWDAEGKKTSGYFKFWEEDNSGGWLQVIKHEFKLKLEKKKVQEGKDFSLRIKSNDRKQGVMKLTIEDSEGYSITNANGTDIYKIDVEYGGERGRDFLGFVEVAVDGISLENESIFDTTKLKMEDGTYYIILEDNATEAEVKVSVKVEKKYIEVECGAEVVKSDDIAVIITSSFYEEEANVTVEGIGNKTVTLDEEGKKKVKFSTENAELGKHKVTVEVCGMKKTKYVTTKEGDASLEALPEESTIGDIVTIKGTSNFGDFAVFVIEDVYKGEARITDDKFEWDWDTSGELDGYNRIEVFIVSESFSAELVNEEWQKKEGVDASAGIFLSLPAFSMTAPKEIAEDDDVIISGTALGTDHVYVIVMDHKGEVMFPLGETVKSTPAEDDKWEENIGELDSGRYTVIAVHKGKDGESDVIKDNDEWEAGDGSKTLEQRVAILMDALISAGSDDLFERADFSVSAPKVILKEPKTVVEIGDEITVKAETNIREGEKAFISLFQNTSSNNLKKTFALVENGSVNASINTSGLLPGIYTVAVDISGRASAEKEIILVEKKEVVEEGKEEIAQNESLTEPGTVEKANESIGVGEGEINESCEEEEERKIPVNVWDLRIAVVMAIFISFAVRRGRR
jgi:hypothetical protein